MGKRLKDWLPFIWDSFVRSEAKCLIKKLGSLPNVFLPSLKRCTVGNNFFLFFRLAKAWIPANFFIFLSKININFFSFFLPVYLIQRCLNWYSACLFFELLRFAGMILSGEKFGFHYSLFINVEGSAILTCSHFVYSVNIINTASTPLKSFPLLFHILPVMRFCELTMTVLPSYLTDCFKHRWIKKWNLLAIMFQKKELTFWCQSSSATQKNNISLWRKKMPVLFKVCWIFYCW